MLPDIGAGMPWTAVWFAGALFLLALTIIAGGTLTLLSRSLQKRDTADAQRDDRVAKLEEQIREQELQSLERDGQHQKEIHKLQLEILKCQKDFCGRSVSREEYMGDFLRMQAEVQEAVRRLESKMEDFITRIHARVDALMGNPEVEKK